MALAIPAALSSFSATIYFLWFVAGMPDGPEKQAYELIRRRLRLTFQSPADTSK
jgi:hypothetical protein